MNHIARIPSVERHPSGARDPSGAGDPLPPRLPAPELSAGLRRAVELVRLDSRRHLPGVAPALGTEACDLVAAMRDLCTPAAVEVVDAWMERVFIGCNNPPNTKGKLLRVAAVLGVCGDLPRACWTGETYASYVRHYGEKSDWWPGPGMVDAFLRPIGAELASRRSALEQIAAGLPVLAAPDAAADWDDPTPEGRARIVRGIVAKLGGGGVRREARGVAEQIEAVVAKQGPRATRYPTADQLREMRAARRREMGLAPLGRSRPP
ncbi:MAG TPA: hypothetical protein VGC15_14035 [Acetobacteraceae bacterium]